jgi:tetratricopeptide (TPR) repeat protein
MKIIYFTLLLALGLSISVPAQNKSLVTTKVENKSVTALPQEVDWQKLGLVSFKKGDFQGAFEAFGKCLEKTSSDETCLKYRGLSLLKMYNYGDAINDFSAILQTSSKDKAEIYQQRGICYYMMSKFEAALADFNSSLNIQPNNSAVLDWRGMTYLLLGKINEAISDFQAAFKIQPNNESAAVNLGAAYLGAKRYDEALKHYSSLIRRYPKKAEYLMFRGNSYAVIKKFELAVRDFSKAIKMQPKNAHLFKLRSDVYCVMGKKDLSKADEKMVIKLGVAVTKKCQ